jgi:hypothetical protein
MSDIAQSLRAATAITGAFVEIPEERRTDEHAFSFSAAMATLRSVSSNGAA